MSIAIVPFSRSAVVQLSALWQHSAMIEFRTLADDYPDLGYQVMSYRAVKIPLSCDQVTVRRWSNYMLAHMDEVLASLHREGVRHEAWYLCPGEPLCVIGIMDVTDALAAQKAMSTSSLSVDEVHREFKRHWVHSGITAFEYDPGEYQFQEGAELLFSAHPK